MQTIPNPKIVRSNRRSLSMQITQTGELIIKAPLFAPDSFIQKFINEKEEWILKNLQKVAGNKVPLRTYQEGDEFLYLGKLYKLSIGNYKEIAVGENTLNFPNFLQFRIQKELNNWFLKKAKEVISERVEYQSKRMDTQYKNLRFSDTSSKWGTCFPDNSLQFNWKLIMTPLEVLDSVVIHELAHTVEKNHGPRFWSKVRFFTPAYKQHKKWLESHKHLLII